MTQVDHVNEQIRFAHLFERGFERFDESVRKFSEEPDGVGEQGALVVRQSQTTGGGVERGEKFVLCHYVRAGEQIQERRFTRVGVTDNSRARPLMPFPSLALDRANFANTFELTLEPRDSFLDSTAVDFQLGFARTPRAN